MHIDIFSYLPWQQSKRCKHVDDWHIIDYNKELCNSVSSKVISICIKYVYIFILYECLLKHTENYIKWAWYHFLPYGNQSLPLLTWTLLYSSTANLLLLARRQTLFHCGLKKSVSVYYSGTETSIRCSGKSHCLEKWKFYDTWQLILCSKQTFLI